MNTRRRFRAVAGGIFATMLAGHAWGGADTANNSSSPASSFGTEDQFRVSRSASGIDLNTVQCAYAWALTARIYLDHCNPEGDTELKEDLDYELVATAEFFIANSPHPDTAKQDMETLRKQAVMALPKFKDDGVCSAGVDDRNHGVLKVYSDALRAIPSNERRAKVRKLLTVPGPALQMCSP